MGSKRKKPRNLKKLVKEDLEAKGWVVGDVETRRGPCTFDLFGVADLLSFSQTAVNLVQVTSTKNRASHADKINAWEGRLCWLRGIERSIVLALVDDEGRITYEYFD